MPAFIAVIGNESTVQFSVPITDGVDCAPAYIGHKRTAEVIKVISCFIALLSINVVGYRQILLSDKKTIINSAGISARRLLLTELRLIYP